MTEQDEYGVSANDLKGGGGGNKAKPTKTYTVRIKKAEAKKDKNQKLLLKLDTVIEFGPNKKGHIFDNLLYLSNQENKFKVARRNSFAKALGLKEGARIPGTPGGLPAEALEDTLINVNLEHVYKDVPGQQYDVTTRNGGKLPDGVTEADVQGIEPEEIATFYSIADEFEGIGGAPSDQDDAPWAKSAPDDEPVWG